MYRGLVKWLPWSLFNIFGVQSASASSTAFRTFGLEISYHRYTDRNKTRVSTTNYAAVVNDYQRKLFSEEMRIIYVAMTRAKNKLIFVGSEDCPKNRVCYQNWLALC